MVDLGEWAAQIERQLERQGHAILAVAHEVAQEKMERGEDGLTWMWKVEDMLSAPKSSESGTESTCETTGRGNGDVE